MHSAHRVVVHRAQKGGGANRVLDLLLRYIAITLRRRSKMRVKRDGDLSRAVQCR